VGTARGVAVTALQFQDFAVLPDRVNSGVEVVNLGSIIYEVILTSIEVKSDQGKGATVDGHVDPDI